MIGLLVMPYFGFAPEAGLDSSWAAALHMVKRQNLLFGRDIVFTFGPLGWLVGASISTPVTGVIAMLMRVPLLIGSAMAICSLWRKVVPGLPALILGLLTTWVAVSTLANGGELPALVPFAIGGWVLMHLLRSDGSEVSRLQEGSELISKGSQKAPWTLAIVCALTTLAKFDAGVAALAVGACGFGAMTSFRLHRGTLQVASIVTGLLHVVIRFAACVITFWVLTGQQLEYLWQWFSHSLNLTLGYQSAMVVTARPVSDGWIFLGFVSLVIGCLLAVRTRTSPIRFGWSLLFLLGLFAMVAKQSFTRHDGGHVLRLCSAVAMFALGIAASQSQATRRVRMQVVSLAALAVVLSSVFAWNIDPNARRSLLQPSGRIDQFQRMVKTALFASERRRIISEKQTVILRTLEITPPIAAAASGKRIHVEGWEVAGAWSLATTQKGTWSPLPVFQSYSAYTSELDDLNRDRLADAKRGPEVIFVETRTIDGRWSRWESPEAMLQMLCSFRPGPSTQRWQVMERRPDGSGCSTPVPLGEPITAVLGGPLVTPSAPQDGFVTVRFTELPVRKVRSLVTRSSTWWVLRPYEAGVRLLEGHAAQAHILSVPACLRGSLGPIDTSSTPLLSVSPVNSEPKPTTRTVTARYEFVPFRCP
jgi:hypothetical protein